MATVIVLSEPASAETRVLKLYFGHTGERAEITYKKNGRYLQSGLNKLNHFLRDWRRDEATKMDPRLFDLVWEVYRKTGAKGHIHVVSAYRSPATNAMLRSRSNGVARKSQHTLGKAMDFYIPGVSSSKLRETAMKLQVGGVGYYPRSASPFVHLDVAGVRAWPRMSREQLARLFPDGRTLHMPTDGKPMPGYEQALADQKRRRASGGRIQIASADTEDNGNERRNTRNLFANLFGNRPDRDDDRDDDAASTASDERPTRRSSQPAAAVEIARAPLPSPRPVLENVGTVIAAATVTPDPSAPVPDPSAPVPSADGAPDRAEGVSDGSTLLALAAAPTPGFRPELRPQTDLAVTGSQTNGPVSGQDLRLGGRDGAQVAQNAPGQEETDRLRGDNVQRPETASEAASVLVAASSSGEDTGGVNPVSNRGQDDQGPPPLALAAVNSSAVNSSVETSSAVTIASLIVPSMPWPDMRPPRPLSPDAQSPSSQMTGTGMKEAAPVINPGRQFDPNTAPTVVAVKGPRPGHQAIIRSALLRDATSRHLSRQTQDQADLITPTFVTVQPFSENDFAIVEKPVKSSRPSHRDRHTVRDVRADNQIDRSIRHGHARETQLASTR